MTSAILAANWKMNGDRAAVAQRLSWVLDSCEKLKKIQWLLFPPFPYLSMCHDQLAKSPVALGAQDVSAYTEGAYTGQVSAAMLQDVGAEYVLVGHSERRHGLAENDVLLAQKCDLALQSGLSVIFCVGETQDERLAGKSESVVLSQLAVVEALLKRESNLSERLMVAYEPVWAIGTGLIAKSEDVMSMHQAIGRKLALSCQSTARIPLLYGGSVKSSNAAELISIEGVDGFLVGGASLTKDFIKIGEICSN